MRKTEQKLWDRMRSNLKKHVRMERIENIVGVGIPDVLALSNGITTPTELKAKKDYPKRAATRVFGNDGLSQDQKNWHMDWQAWGGKSLIVAAVGLDMYAVPGSLADSFNDLNCEDLEPFLVDWEELLLLLRGEL